MDGHFRIVIATERWPVEYTVVLGKPVVCLASEVGITVARLHKTWGGGIDVSVYELDSTERVNLIDVAEYIDAQAEQ